MCIMKLPMRMILKRIADADSREINSIICALISWQERVYPEYELVVLSLPKYSKAHREYLVECFTDFMRKEEYVQI